MNESVLALAKNEYVLTELGSGHWDIRYVVSKFPKALEIFDEVTKDATEAEKAIALAVWARPAWKHIRELDDNPVFSVDNLRAYARQALEAAKLFTEAVSDESEVELSLAQASFINRIRDCFGLTVAMKVRAGQALDFASSVLKAFEPEAPSEEVEEEEVVEGLPIEEIKGIPEKLIPFLKEAGFKTAESIAEATEPSLVAVKNVAKKTAPRLIELAKAALAPPPAEPEKPEGENTPEGAQEGSKTDGTPDGQPEGPAT